MRLSIGALAIGVLVLCEAPSAFGGDCVYVTDSYLVGVDEPESVFRVDLDNGERVVFYQRDDVRHVRVEVSPNQRYIAVHSMNSDYAYTCITVLDGEGNEQMELLRGYDSFAWNADGTKLAYTIAYRDKDLQWRTYGVNVMDTNKNLDEWRRAGDYGSAVSWGSFDGRLYIRKDGGTVVAYDYETRETIQTPYKDVWFSSDGVYYWTSSNDRQRIRLVLRETEKDISDLFPFLRSDECTNVDRWLNGNILVFKGSEPKESQYLLFCDTGLTLRVPGMVLALGKEPASVYVSRYPDGKIAKVPLDKLEVRHQAEERIKTAISGSER